MSTAGWILVGVGFAIFVVWIGTKVHNAIRAEEEKFRKDREDARY